MPPTTSSNRYRIFPRIVHQHQHQRGRNGSAERSELCEYATDLLREFRDRLNNAQVFLTQEQTQLTTTESTTLDVNMATAVTDLTQAEPPSRPWCNGAQVSQVNLFTYLPTQ